jgi:hypothetical protein
MSDTDRNRHAASAGGWRRLALSDEAVEVVAYLELRPDSTPDRMAADVLPGVPLADALSRLSSLVAEVNNAATAATGKPGAVIGSSDRGSALGVQRPELYVHMLTAAPFVEAR